jgi:hypothetical protein
MVLAAKRQLLKQNPVFKQVARRLKRVGYKLFGDNENVVRSGNWHGNDTVWRMCLDLNRILMYASPNGAMRDTPKRYLSIVDGIYAMEGNGPVAGTLKRAGLVVRGCRTWWRMASRAAFSRPATPKNWRSKCAIFGRTPNSAIGWVERANRR